MKQDLSVKGVFLAVLLLIGGCRAGDPKTSSDARRSAARVETAASAEGPPRVRIETTHGDLVVELRTSAAPATCLNFVHFAQSGYYDGTVFHRVAKNTLIQGGGFTPDMKEKPLNVSPVAQDTWRSPLGLEPGAVALVRAPALRDRRSAQFFITVGDAALDPHLLEGRSEGRFSVFGKVVEGMETVERVRNVGVSTHPHYAAGRSPVVPVEPVVIRSVTVLTPFDREKVGEAAELAAAPEEERIAALIRRLEAETGSQAIRSESSLRYIDLVVGRGAIPVPGDFVEFHYHGTLLNGEVFESTLDKEPVVREVQNLIPGLREGLLGMREGGRRVLIVSPELAYGAGGIPGYIPPEATLVYEVELLAIK